MNWQVYNYKNVQEDKKLKRYGKIKRNVTIHDFPDFLCKRFIYTFFIFLITYKTLLTCILYQLCMFLYLKDSIYYRISPKIVF